MRTAPDHFLQPATVAFALDLTLPPETLVVDDSTLRRLALGIADEATCLRCAQAMLGSPSLRSRLVEIAAHLAEDFGGGLPRGEDLDDVGRLAAFVGTFSRADASFVYPDRFLDEARLARLVRHGWLAVAEDRYRLDPRLFEFAPRHSDRDSGLRLVDRSVQVADEVDRIVAEGRWDFGSRRLRDELPNLRNAWRVADEMGNHEAIEAFVRSLLALLMEAGEWKAFDELGTCASRAVDAQGVRFRRLLLSYLGAGAARRGDSETARSLWSERLRLAREAGNFAVEADTLLDLAAQAANDGDMAMWSAWMSEAEVALGRAERPDLTATLWSVRARERFDANDLRAAAAHAERALATLGDTNATKVGLFVRMTSVRVLVGCGHRKEAAAVSTEILRTSVEGGQALQAAEILGDLGEIAWREDHPNLAVRCLLGSCRIHEGLGTRLLGEARERLATFLATRSEIPDGAWPYPADHWHEGALEILDAFADLWPSLRARR